MINAVGKHHRQLDWLMQCTICFPLWECVIGRPFSFVFILPTLLKSSSKQAKEWLRTTFCHVFPRSNKNYFSSCLFPNPINCYFSSILNVDILFGSMLILFSRLRLLVEHFSLYIYIYILTYCYIVSWIWKIHLSLKIGSSKYSINGL